MTMRKIYSNMLKVSRQNNICDSGVVGNARPCQGRDRGFEPRLSLRKSLVNTRLFLFRVAYFQNVQVKSF